MRSVLRDVPGLNVLQAVVKVEGQLGKEHFKTLETRLDIQKNKLAFLIKIRYNKLRTCIFNFFDQTPFYLNDFNLFGSKCSI